MMTRAGSMLALVGVIFFASPVPGIDSSTATDKATPATTVELDHDDGFFQHSLIPFLGDLYPPSSMMTCPRISPSG